MEQQTLTFSKIQRTTTLQNLQSKRRFNQKPIIELENKSQANRNFSSRTASD